MFHGPATRIDSAIMRQTIPRLVVAGSTVLFAATASAECDPVPGLAPLLEPGAALLAGEMHGTREAPEFVRSVVCAGLEEGLPVTVGLEIDRADDGAYQEFLRSDGSAAARERLLAAPFWHREFQDGRSSRAMLELMEGLRDLATRGDLRVVLLDRPEPGDERDGAMAERLAEAMDERPDDLFVVLTGNIHNRLTKGMPWDGDLEPMGYRLRRLRPDARILSLDMAYPGGAVWACFGPAPSDCKEQEVKGSPAAVGRTGVELVEEAEGKPYSGRYFAGPLTPSEPAVAPDSR